MFMFQSLYISLPKSSRISTTTPRMPTTLGYFPKASKDPTPDLSNDERKKLGLVYYKPLSKELEALLEAHNTIGPRDVPNENEVNDSLQLLKEEIKQEIEELNDYALENASPSITPYQSDIPVSTTTKKYSPPNNLQKSPPATYKEPIYTKISGQCSMVKLRVWLNYIILTS